MLEFIKDKFGYKPNKTRLWDLVKILDLWLKRSKNSKTLESLISSAFDKMANNKNISTDVLDFIGFTLGKK